MNTIKKMMIAMAFIGTVFTGNAMARAASFEPESMTSVRTFTTVFAGEENRVEIHFIGDNNCTSVYFDESSDNALLSSVLTAFSTKSKYWMLFDTGAKASWDITSCKLLAFSLEK